MKNFSASLVCLLLTLAALSASAQTIRRVNNTGISGPNIYGDLPAAYTAAAAGDIIQVEPSGTSYTGVVVNKNVTIVGPGYFLDPTSQNAGLQANPLTASVNNISVQAGGANAYIAGLTVANYYIEASNVTVQRCYISSNLLMNATGNDGTTGQAITGTIIRQNYINSVSQYNSFASDNILFANNVINNFSLPTNYNGGIFNNVFQNSGAFSNFFATNNYFANTNYGSGNTLNNNISASASFPTTNGNQAGIPQNAVFVLAPGATAFDGWYQLKAGTNPARGTGAGGTDIGIFSTYSTNAPYKLGGLPNIPAIYQQSQTITGNSLNGTLSTRSNN